MKANQVDLPGPLILLMVLGFLGLVLSLFYFADPTIVSMYTHTMLSLSVIGSALWIRKIHSVKTHLILLIPLTVIILKLFYPHIIIFHNLYILLAVSWLAPFLIASNVLTRKRLLFISLLWFIYDIIYVWLSPLHEQATVVTASVSLPLAMITPRSAIGTGDLLYAAMLIHTLNTHSVTKLSVLLFIISNIILDVFAVLLGFNVFPLLVLWVPLGIFLLFVDHKNSSKLQTASVPPHHPETPARSHLISLDRQK